MKIPEVGDKFLYGNSSNKIRKIIKIIHYESSDSSCSFLAQDEGGLFIGNWYMNPKNTYLFKFISKTYINQPLSLKGRVS